MTLLPTVTHHESSLCQLWQHQPLASSRNSSPWPVVCFLACFARNLAKDTSSSPCRTIFLTNPSRCLSTSSPLRTPIRKLLPWAGVVMQSHPFFCPFSSDGQPSHCPDGPCARRLLPVSSVPFSCSIRLCHYDRAKNVRIAFHID